jgi:hypothetical protein
MKGTFLSVFASQGAPIPVFSQQRMFQFSTNPTMAASVPLVFFLLVLVASWTPSEMNFRCSHHPQSYTFIQRHALKLLWRDCHVEQ